MSLLKQTRQWTLILAAALLLSACDETYEDEEWYDDGHTHEVDPEPFYSHVPDGFQVYTWDGGSPALIDPYRNDGVFELAWDVAFLHEDARIQITLGDEPRRSHGDVALYDGHCGGRGRACSLLDSQVYQYDTLNRISALDRDGRLTPVAELTDWSPYGRVLYMHFKACTTTLYCHRQTRAVEFR